MEKYDMVIKAQGDDPRVEKEGGQSAPSGMRPGARRQCSHPASLPAASLVAYLSPVKPKDKDREEKESLSWMVLLPNKWSKDGQNAWRFDPCELGVQGARKARPRAPMIDECVTDVEYLTSDEAYLTE